MSNNTRNTYEELETSDELKASGLRRIKRKFQPKKGEMTLKNCQVITEVRIDASNSRFDKLKKMCWKNKKEFCLQVFLDLTIFREVSSIFVKKISQTFQKCCLNS